MNKRMRIACILFSMLLAIVAFSAYPGTAYANNILLKMGSRGSEVATLQQALINLGFLSDRADGIFGPITRKAVIDFQKANNLVPDGIAGPKTFGKLYGSGNANNGNPASSNSGSEGTAISRTLRQGDRGTDVITLQKRLNELGFNCGKADGIFGPKTHSAVIAFQKANSLYVDGIVGKNTRAKLFSSNASSGNGSVSRGDSDTGLVDSIIAYAQKYLGAPYKYGAAGPDAFDCSGFTSYIFKHFGISLLRSAKDQGYNDNFPKLSRQELKKGDLVFFDTISDNDYSDHVGIYIGDGKFIHASSSNSKYVRIDTLDSGYYQRTFVWGRRIL
ncbi:MAG: hypothetical protein GX041_08685 [Clostridiales bacterium]|jgi:peptidoglycan hydrolase-like protein with peptidoglycan-binding domain|nr:hypothetical protein [Clostridiales bacterium]